MTDAESAPSTPRPDRPAEPLDAGTPPRLADRARVPGYDRAALTPALVQISVGGSTRAHQLVHLDELAERGCTDRGVVCVGLHSTRMRDALAPRTTSTPWWNEVPTPSGPGWSAKWWTTSTPRTPPSAQSTSWPPPPTHPRSQVTEEQVPA